MDIVCKCVYICLQLFSAYVHINISSSGPDRILLFVKVKNLLHCCVKQYVHVDLTSRLSVYWSVFQNVDS